MHQPLKNLQNSRSHFLGCSVFLVFGLSISSFVDPRFFWRFGCTFILTWQGVSRSFLMNAMSTCLYYLQQFHLNNIYMLNFLLFLDLSYSHIMFILQLTLKIKLLVLSSPFVSLLVSYSHIHNSTTV